VIDHGPGVPREQRDLIFEPFQRLDERSGGVGLGLSVAKGFTEAMGGSIEAVETRRGGLTMRLTLLAAKSGVAATLEAAQ
jgi:two-component system sensor histidine kinase KdpD